MFEAIWKLFRHFGEKPSAPTESGQTKTILPAEPFLETSPSVDLVSYVFADTETTGLNHGGDDEIVEIAILDAEGATLLNTLVRPMRKTSWPEAQAIHGISPQHVATAPSLAALLPKIAATCAGKTVVFYNAPFDLSFFPQRFFPSVVCAMRCYCVATSTQGWVKLMDAAMASGYDPAGRPCHRALADALACRHVWLRGIPFMENLLPLNSDSKIIARLNMEETEGIPLTFNGFFPEEMIFVAVNDRCRLWTKDDRDMINIYRPRTLGGNGKVATLSKIDNPELTELLASGHEIEMRLSKRSRDALAFDVMVTASRKAAQARPLPAMSVTLSPIDDDIYKCFIAHQSGMCDAIGTWDDFRKVEAEIARICKEHGGRYYKSKAKGAKFAIIFSPHAQTDRDAWDLQQDGYKVTSFDLAVAFFGLEATWDCPRYAAHVKQVQAYG